MVSHRSRGAAIGLAGLLLAAPAPGPARADYRVCNQSKITASVAIAYHRAAADGPGLWISEGWWNIAPGKCSTVIGGALTVRYVYLYGESGDGSHWGGDKPFCTKTAEFTVTDQDRCASRGLATTRFLEVDTGGASKTYTTNLTE